MPAIQTYSSLCLLSMLRIYLWRLFANFPRIDDEFGGVCVLILLHQLQIGEPLSAFYRIAAGKLRFCRFDQLRCHFIPAICGETVGSVDNLCFGEAQIVKEKLFAIHPARMSQTLKVCLPVPDILIVDSVDHMLAQDVVRLM